MNIKKLVATAALAGFLGVSDLGAQEVQFKTMEIRSIAGLQEEPVLVDVARRHRRRRTRSRTIVKRRNRRRSAAVVGGSAAG
jgi:hypothetical protein